MQINIQVTKGENVDTYWESTTVIPKVNTELENTSKNIHLILLGSGRIFKFLKTRINKKD